jgi:serine/threonine protein kinase/Tol biopolymer transport system component
MALASGTRLGPYEIQSPLGAGGMGEVYRAKDTRLERTVAIKILPAHLSNDPVRKQRFEREAKTISSLNHPHICVLYDVGHQDGTDYLVLECVEGETLAKRLERGPLPLEQVLKYGAQIADALDKAHRSGVVHRDLKPGNIVLAATGAKLLDFGLAKPVRPLASGLTLTLDESRAAMTEEGMIVGTFQYMSPEQVQGEGIDGRSDIFSLGAVLYEMVTGKRAFEGKSHLSVASAILEEEPDPLTSTNPLTPQGLNRTIRKCIAKLPDERWQSASDLASELKWLGECELETTASAPRLRPRSFWRGAMWGTISLAALALAIGATYYGMRTVEQSPLVVSMVPPAGVFVDTSGRIGPPQISPDGKMIAFIGCKTESAASSMIGDKTCSVWLRVLASSEFREVADTHGAYYPFWSPDGRDVAFFADGRLKRVAAEGGPVQVICDAADARGGSWGSSGTIIFAPGRLSPIYRVAADGGTPVVVTQTHPSEGVGVASHRWPHFLPDGNHFLYLHTPYGQCNEQTEIRFASLESKEDVSLIQTCSSPAFANRRLIFWRDGNLVAQPFDPRTGILTGVPSAIAEHAYFEPLFSIAKFSVSAEGKLLYIVGDSFTGSQLVWIDRSGKVLGTLGGKDHYKSLVISRDGLRVVADTIGLKETKVLILDVRGARTLITMDHSDGASPTWSPDGRKIYFTVNAPRDIHVRAADGSGEEREIVKFSKDQSGASYLAVSPDGKFLVYVLESATNRDIYTVALDGVQEPQPFLHSPANESAPAFSPDGKWLAYESNTSGRNEAYITPFPAGGAQYQVSTNGGERPVWRRDGKEIYYREGLVVMAAQVDITAGGMEFGSPKPLFELASGNLYGRYYDVAPDGRFLANTSPPTANTQTFSLVVNWPAKLNK